MLSDECDQVAGTLIGTWLGRLMACPETGSNVLICLKKGLAKEDHDGYDSRHVNLPDDVECLLFQHSADYG